MKVAPYLRWISEYCSSRDDTLPEEGRSTVIEQFPHCDSRVLHAPGECEVCDRHPDWQQLRVLWNINFTGHYNPDLLICPAEAARGLGNVGQDRVGWPGNRPTRFRFPDPDEVEDVAQRLRRLEVDLQTPGTHVEPS